MTGRPSPRGALLLLASCGLWLGPGPAARAEQDGAEVQEAIRKQLELQRELLSAVDEAEESPSWAELPEPVGGSRPEPRAAPRAPRERELPPEIFDVSRIRVPEGAWGEDQQEMRVVRQTLDADRNGRPELVRYLSPESKLVLRQEEDRDYDGRIDAVTTYEWGAPVARSLDEGGDGKPDTWERYRGERMVSREVDTDEDGVRDAFFRYEGDSLVEESQDTDGDGHVDVRVVYRDRRRVRSEQDRDQDGRMDMWSHYTVVDGEELVSRIERDERGRGRADTFETFDTKSGSSILARREEDVNGDGEIDVVSIYEGGRLVRREIDDPDLLASGGAGAGLAD
jgi:hypothetical protein